MDATITLSALVNIVLVILGIAVGIFLIILLANLTKSIQRVNTMLDMNAATMHETMKNIGSITKNVSAITQNFEKTSAQIDKVGPEAVDNAAELMLAAKNTAKSTEAIVGKVQETVVTVGDDIMDTTDAIRDNTVDVLSYIKIISEIVKAITAAFQK
jgi:predicted Holliday junction resolvase-like endonuclease